MTDYEVHGIENDGRIFSIIPARLQASPSLN
jgi:hypothetical protein